MKQRVVRFAVAFGLFVLLGGPTPGAVGSCGDKSAPFADLKQYCETRELLSCERRRLRGEFMGAMNPAGEFSTCTTNAIITCQSRFWAPGCRPTTRQVNACLGALQSFDTLEVEEDDLPECKIDALCTVNTLTSDGGMP